jgi:hypothetical protein
MRRGLRDRKGERMRGLGLFGSPLLPGFGMANANADAMNRMNAMQNYNGNQLASLAGYTDRSMIYPPLAQHTPRASGHVCAYCGTRQTTCRCANCGAPA